MTGCDPMESLPSQGPFPWVQESYLLLPPPSLAPVQMPFQLLLKTKNTLPTLAGSQHTWLAAEQGPQGSRGALVLVRPEPTGQSVFPWA